MSRRIGWGVGYGVGGEEGFRVDFRFYCRIGLFVNVFVEKQKCLKAFNCWFGSGVWEKGKECYNGTSKTYRENSIQLIVRNAKTTAIPIPESESVSLHSHCSQYKLCYNMIKQHHLLHSSWWNLLIYFILQVSWIKINSSSESVTSNYLAVLQWTLHVSSQFFLVVNHSMTTNSIVCTSLTLYTKR